MKTQIVSFYHKLRLLEAHLTLNGRHIPFINYLKYPSVIFDEKAKWILHIETIETKVFRIFTRHRPNISITDKNIPTSEGILNKGYL
jgi:hypothetical protein